MARAEIVMPFGDIPMDDMTRTTVPVELENTPRPVHVDATATPAEVDCPDAADVTDVFDEEAHQEQNPQPDSNLLPLIAPPMVPAMMPTPMDPNALATNTTFDAMTVLSMHYQLNEKAFMLLQEGTEVMQISEEDDSTHRGTECTICLEAIETGQMVTKVPCEGGHKFHHECLNRWMGTKLFNEQPAFCPNCNFKILEPLRTREQAEPIARRPQVTPMTRQQFLKMAIPLVIVAVLLVVLFPLLFGRWCPRGCKNNNNNNNDSKNKDPSTQKRCGNCRQAPLHTLFPPLHAEQVRRELRLRISAMGHRVVAKQRPWR